MATDWAADVKKYAPNADDGVIAGIVRYCGIALRKVDSSLVAFSDQKETDRVRENFLKKKLALTQADKTLDAAIAKVGETMKADRTKNRVTVYYLLADNFKKLDLFAPKAKAAAKAPAKKPAGKAAGTAALAGLAAASAVRTPAKTKAAPTAAKAAPAKKAAVVATTKKTPTKKVAIKSPAAPQGLMDKAAGAGTAAVAGTVAAAGAVAATTATAAANVAGAVKDTAAKAVDIAGDAAGAVAGAAGDEDSGLGWLMWLLFAALVAFVLWWVFMRGSPDEAAAPVAATSEAAAPATPTLPAPVDLASAPAEGTVAIPTGAGVTSELRDGKPVVKVYFDTGKTAIVPAFGDAAVRLKAYLDDNAGSSLQVSGFNDPTGGAAVNARLSKRRAEAVGTALVASGIPQTAVALVKPEATTDASTDLAGARRVEVTIK